MKFGSYIVLAAAVCIMLIPVPVAGQPERETNEYEDGEDDVISTMEKRDLTRLVDLQEIEGDTGRDFKQRGQVDIASLKITQDDTFVTYILKMNGDIGTEEQFGYQVAGYRSEDPRSTDPYDFRIVFNGTNATYQEWIGGSFVENGSISQVKINGSKLEIRMNRGNFILSYRSDPFTIAAIAYLDEGVGKEIHIDHLLTTDDEEGEGPLIDETTLIILEFVILGVAFIAVIFVWNVYMKKKGEENQGGICPKCESRLDPSLDFCPSCGTFIRGPNAGSLKKGPFPSGAVPMEEE